MSVLFYLRLTTDGVYEECYCVDLRLLLQWQGLSGLRSVFYTFNVATVFWSRCSTIEACMCDHSAVYHNNTYYMQHKGFLSFFVSKKWGQGILTANHLLKIYDFSGNSGILIVRTQPFLFETTKEEGESSRRAKNGQLSPLLARWVCLCMCVWQECLPHSHVCVFMCDNESIYASEMCS